MCPLACPLPSPAVFDTQASFGVRLIAISCSSQVNRSYLLRSNLCTLQVDRLVYALDALPCDAFYAPTAVPSSPVVGAGRGLGATGGSATSTGSAKSKASTRTVTAPVASGVPLDKVLLLLLLLLYWYRHDGGGVCGMSW